MPRDYIDGDYRIIEYENGTIIKQLISQGNPDEEQITIPPSPLEEIKQQVADFNIAMANLMGV